MVGVRGVRESPKLTPDQQNMFDLIQKRPQRTDKDEDAVKALFILHHNNLVEQFPKDQERRHYVDNLYQAMFAKYDAMKAQGQIAKTGGRSRGSGLFESKPTPPSASPTRAAGSSATKPSVDDLDEQIQRLVPATVKETLGPDVLSSPDLGGKLTFTATFEEGERVKIEITENSLSGLSDRLKENVERAIEATAERLPLPQVSSTQQRTHTLEFGPPKTEDG